MAACARKPILQPFRCNLAKNSYNRPMNKDLFLITGASTGIGHALAIYFAKLGHKVLAGVRSQKDFDSFANVTNLTPIFLDVTKAEHIAKVPPLLESTLSSTQRLILINNAGIAVGGPWEIVSETELRQQLEINVFGAILLTQKCLPLLRRTCGHVFNVSSVSGLFSSPFLGPYSVSKFAMEAFSDSLRREMFKFQVSVTSINPGPIQTPIWDKSLADSKNKIHLDHPVYGSVLKKFEVGINQTVKRALPVSAVVEAVEKEYLSQRPKERVIVATLGTKIFVKLTQVLPARFVDSVLKRF